MSKFVWFEYVSTEAQKAQGFFGELFNWSAQQVPMPQGSYTMIAHGGQTIGGYMTTPEGAPKQAHWLSHLQVTDAQATATKIKSLGGRVGKEPFKVGDHGTMAVVFDPLGGVFALWQPAKLEPSEWKGTPGNWCWNELYTSDPEKSVAFYKAIGGFEVEKMEMPGMGTYHQLKSDGKGRAGVLKSPMPGIPQSWLPYVQVANVDQSVDKAKKLGAAIKQPPTNIPNVGRFAVFTDPQGAALGILQPAS